MKANPKQHRPSLASLLKVALEEAIGRKVKRVFYEPLNGPCMEMQGYAGGWMYKEENGNEDTLGGFSAAEAMKYIVLLAHSRGQDDMIAAYERKEKR